MKVVIDTNVLVSGIFWGGRPFHILEIWTEGKFNLVVSSEILEEYTKVLHEIGCRHDRNDLAKSWCRLISQSAIVIEAPKVFHKCRDPHDNMFVNCAIASGSDIIVSGDADLLSIGLVGKIMIIPCGEALRHFARA